MSDSLRRGYTTGTCAAVASGAVLGAFVRSYSACPTPLEYTIVLPSGETWKILCQISSIAFSEVSETNSYLGQNPSPFSGSSSAPSILQACVVKDSGDDPDVTDGCSVRATLVPKGAHPPNLLPLFPAGQWGNLRLMGGRGVGHVTLEGLKVSPGEAAINPVPREMIRHEIQRQLEIRGLEWQDLPPMDLILSIDEGLSLASKTFNGRLGIEGGISIIGTSGVVEPLSEERWRDSMVEELHVALHRNPHQLGICFGNLGEEALRSDADFPSVPIIQCGNFVGFLFHQALDQGIQDFWLAGPLGKVIKVAAGIFNTHSHVADARSEILTAYGVLCGFPTQEASRLFDCPTTDAGLSLLRDHHLDQDVLHLVCERVRQKLQWELRQEITLHLLITDISGNPLIKNWESPAAPVSDKQKSQLTRKELL